MKTKEELNALKEKVETVSRKLHELTDEELEKVVGGIMTYEEYNRRLAQLSQQNWSSRDEYVDAVNLLISEYKNGQ